MTRFSQRDFGDLGYAYACYLLPMILLIGCASPAPISTFIPSERESIAEIACKSVPIGVPLIQAADVMFNDRQALLMGGRKELAFIALKNPEGCACHVTLDSKGTTVSATPKCVQ